MSEMSVSPKPATVELYREFVWRAHSFLSLSIWITIPAVICDETANETKHIFYSGFSA